MSKSPNEIGPGLKSWLDNVIVPALVSEYLRTIVPQNGIALRSDDVIESAPTIERPREDEV